MKNKTASAGNYGCSEPERDNLTQSADMELDEEEIRERVHTARDASLPGEIASDVEPRRLRWLWPGYLPLGMFCGLEGDPGEGKSLITIDIAARITTGSGFPDGAKCEPGSVIIISGEDDPAVTLRPRLEAAGADLSRVLLWTKDLPTLPKDLPELLRSIKDFHPRLAILDPVDCFYGDKIDPNSNPSVRRVLRPLADCASRLSCTILGVRHLNKDAKVSKAIYRGSGSIGFAGQARAVFLANPTREDPDLRAFARVKGNLSKPPPTLGYRIVEAGITTSNGTEIKTQKVDWTGPLNATADDLLREPDASPRGPKPDKLETAKTFLRQVLADGTWHQSTRIIEAAKTQGVGYRTLMDATLALRVVKTKKGFVGGWHWSLSIGASENSATSTKLNGENDSAEVAEEDGNSATSSPIHEDAEFCENGYATSTKPCSDNAFINSGWPDSSEDAEFSGPPDDADRF
jgi:putative DNA primase/helicase